MVKFIFVTQSNRSTSYSGPSGKAYMITLGYSFEVSNPMDIAFFDSNSRFQRVLLKKVPEPVTQIKLDTKYLKELEDIYGVSKKLAKVIFDIYPVRDKLVEVVEMGHNLGSEIPRKAKERLKKHFFEVRGD